MSAAFRYYIEHRDTDGVLLARIEDLVTDFEFAYNRIGGMGEFEMEIKKTYEGSPRFSADDDIRIYVKPTAADVYSLYYRGYVNSFEPKAENTDAWTLRGTGYVGQLDRLIVTATYGSTLVEDIVKDILDNYAVGLDGVDLTYDPDDIEATGLVIAEAVFDDTLANAMEKLADIVGQREWGVDANAGFFFKQRSSEVRNTLFIGNDFKAYSVFDDWENIANRIEIRGARRNDGSIYDYVVNNTQSQALFGLRAQLYNNSSINNDTDAARYGQALLQESSNVSRKAKGELTVRGTSYHATTPLGVVQVPNLKTGFTRTIFGPPLYGVPKYGGVDTFQINSVSYRLAPGGSGFDITLDLGNTRPELFTPIARLEFGLEQVQAR